MDPWSTNEWMEPVDRVPSSKFEFDPDLGPSSQDATFHASGTPWPAHQFSLPGWDTPSPPPSNSPVAETTKLDESGKPAMLSTDTDSTTQPKHDQLVTSIQTLNVHTLPNSPTNSFKTAYSASSDQWVESTQSPPSEPTMELHRSTEQRAAAGFLSSPTLASTSPNREHPPSDSDDVRWGTFTQTDIVSISSTLSFQPDPVTNFPSDSPTQSGWNGETNLDGWDNGMPRIDHSLPSLETSLHMSSQDDEEMDPNQNNTSWSSPPFSDNHNRNQENGFQPAWDQSEPCNVHRASSMSRGQQQLADQRWSPRQTTEKLQEFLSSTEAYTPSELASNLSPSAELSGASKEPPQYPLPNISQIPSQHLFQNSSSSDAFQAVVSKTAQVAANVLKSANKPLQYYANVVANPPASPQSSPHTVRPQDQKTTSEKVDWGDLSALEASSSNSAAPSGASVQQQSEQKARGGFFRLWTSKASPVVKTPDPNAEGASSILPSGTLGSCPLPSQKFSHQSKDSVSSVSPSSTVWPAPSPVSPDPLQATTTSTMSRLFGRFGARSNSASASLPIEDDHSAFAAPSTELDANEAKILDLFTSVPMQSGALNDDDLPLGHNATQSKLNKINQKMNPPDVFDPLVNNPVNSDLSTPVTSGRSPPLNFPSSSRGADPFDFINSSNLNQHTQSQVEISTSSGFRPFSSQFDSLSSRPKNQLPEPGLAVGNQPSSGDDLDVIFSAFQGSGTPTRAKVTLHSTTGIPNEPGQISNRLSTQNKPSTKVMPKPLMNKVLTSQVTPQVRLTGNSPQPILRQNSDQIGAISTKIPILPPPPSSSGGTGSNSISPMSPSQNKVKILSPPSFSSSIPPLQTKTNSPIQKPSSSHNSSHQSSLSPDQHSLFPTLSVPHQTFTSATNTQKNLNFPAQTGKSLSKEDLSFFDSLM